MVSRQIPRKVVAEAQKDGYLAVFFDQLDLDEDGLPNWKTINSFVELVRTSTQNNPPDGEMNTPREKLDRLMNAIFLKTFNLRNYEEDPLSAGEILLFTKLESIDRRDQFATRALYLAAPTILKLRGLKGGYDVRRNFFLSCLQSHGRRYRKEQGNKNSHRRPFRRRKLEKCRSSNLVRI